MTNPLWLWLIEQRMSAYSANQIFQGPSSREAGPCWCFDRYGRTETRLPDGRVINIGGEHEDYYDEDFYIYNDVVVCDDKGGVEILGYPEDDFPPTDFHTATLVDDRIVLIGNLSYPKLRKSETQVILLNTGTFRIERKGATGNAPLWIHSHTSELEAGGTSVLVRGGLIDDRRWPGLVENIDDWRLDLDTWRWERLTHRRWHRFKFIRSDRKSNHLFWLRDLISAWTSNRPDKFADRRAEWLRDLGETPRLDLVEALYSPNIEHVWLPRGQDEFNLCRIRIDGVTVRYAESDYDITLTIEGSLPLEAIELLRSDLLNKLEAIENARVDCVPIEVP